MFKKQKPKNNFNFSSHSQPKRRYFFTNSKVFIIIFAASFLGLVGVGSHYAYKHALLTKPGTGTFIEQNQFIEVVSAVNNPTETTEPPKQTAKPKPKITPPTNSPPPSMTTAPPQDEDVDTDSRYTTDKADDISGKQVHVLYVIPSDGSDRKLDTNGAIKNSVAAFQKWLKGQTGNKKVRIDTYQGKTDITFFKLSKTDAQIKSRGAYVRDELESLLEAAGFNNSNKIYAVYYDGGSTYACGGGAWPPALPGNYAAMYLKGTPPGANCANNPVGARSSTPGYIEYAMLHEIFHTLGAVATCAPNHAHSGHVGDNPTDLMYSGSQSWNPSKLDIGRNDYYGHSNNDCFDIADSPYLG